MKYARALTFAAIAGLTVVTTGSTVAPSRASNSPSHAAVFAACPASGEAAPQTTPITRRVAGVVFVRCASFTAFAHGPSAS